MRKVKSLTIEYCGVFSFEPFAAMVHFAEINPIVKEIAERARCEGNAALVFCDLGVAAFGDDFAAIKFANELSNRF